MRNAKVPVLQLFRLWVRLGVEDEDVGIGAVSVPELE